VTTRRRRHGRIILLSFLLLVAGVVLGIRWFFSGPRLAHFLTGVLFDGKIRGKVEIGSIDWPFTAILQRRIPATLTDRKSVV